MALIICVDCGRQISDEARTCLGCGRPSEKKHRTHWKGLGVVFGVAVGGGGLYGAIAGAPEGIVAGLALLVAGLVVFTLLRIVGRLFS